MLTRLRINKFRVFNIWQMDNRIIKQIQSMIHTYIRSYIEEKISGPIYAKSGAEILRGRYPEGFKC